MSRLRQVHTFAPCTVANLAVGFDVLGLALDVFDGPPLGDRVTAQRRHSGIDLEVRGPHAVRLPDNPRHNLVWHVAEHFLSLLSSKGVHSGVSLILDKRVEPASGLGSSASSAAAVTRALDELFDHPFDEKTLVSIAAEGERFACGTAHYDNVAPSLLGGVRLCSTRAGETLCLPWPQNWSLAIIRPNHPIATRDAREVLRRTVPFEIAVEHARHLATFVAALFSARLDLAVNAARDHLAEPDRARLLPGFESAMQEALAQGALFASFSGSGPAVFAVCDGIPTSRKIGQAVEVVFREHGMDSSSFVAGIDPRGARLQDEPTREDLRR